MRRLIAGLLVCLTVCLSCFSPAMAASTTDSQIMFSKDSDSGISPMSFDDGGYKVKVYGEVYDAYDYSNVNSTYVESLVDDVVSNNTVAYSPGLQTRMRSAYNKADIAAIKDGYAYVVWSMGFYTNISSASDYLLAAGDNLSLRIDGIAVQFSNSSNSSYWSSSNLVFDHAEIEWWPFGVGSTRRSVLSNVDFYDLLSPTWHGISFSTYAPFSISSMRVLVYFKFPVSDFSDFFSDDDSVNLRSYFGGGNYPDTRIFFNIESGSVSGGETSEIMGGLNSVNSSLQSVISGLQGMSSDLAAMSQSINQMRQDLTAKLEQQTQMITAAIETQINQIKAALGLVTDELQSGFSQTVNVITNQTTQITGKIDSLQQNVTNKLDTVNTSITDLMDETKQGFTDVKKGITDLPGKVGEMLQGLIVPDSEKVSGKFEDFNNLAEEKLGVIYQVPEMVISMGQSVVSGAVEQKGEMTLPKFEIIMPATNQSRAGERLTVWEEYTFPIWPEGTEVIHTAVQTATSLVCVIAMINSIKRKYEDWLDGK